MGYEFHKDKKRYFEYQRINADKYLIPFIEEVVMVGADTQVLEIGCAEGGVLKAFLDRGCKGTGVELSDSRAQLASEYLASEIEAGNAAIISKNIYDVDFESEFSGNFDIIVLKDVIEHIHDQEKLIAQMKLYLKPGGHIFFGFPPWQMPYGGHQQISKKKISSRLPYYHILPKFMYRGMLKLFGERGKVIDDLMEIKDTRISLERFERIVKKKGYSISHKTLYFINPIYELKFKIKPRKQSKLVGAIPYFRNYFTTCGYYLITPVA